MNLFETVKASVSVPDAAKMYVQGKHIESEYMI